jgi:hypothetical protein
VVTAEDTAWYLAGDPIEWNGDVYYPGGAVQFFNRYQMVRSGFFKGIPLYTDATLEPNITIFVPLPAERMQPYQRARIGQLAGTSGNRPALVPDEAAREPGFFSGLSQAAAEPAFAPPYDVPYSVEEFRGARRPTAFPGSPAPLAIVDATWTVSTVRPPTGVNNIWIDYNGRRWVNGGRAIRYDAARLTEVGKYHGWSVYTRDGDRSTIYIPTTPGRLAPYKPR